MNDVFLDTVGLFAVWDVADQWNAKADAAYRTVIQHGLRVATTPHIACGFGRSIFNYSRNLV